jgi:hypothetical protein
MANNPPPYSDITGISRAVMKDNAQTSIVNYDGNARPGEMVVDLTVDPPSLYIGNNAGQLTTIFSGSTDYGNANVVNLLSSFGSNTISTTGNVAVGNLIYTETFGSWYSNVTQTIASNTVSNISVNNSWYQQGITAVGNVWTVAKTGTYNIQISYQLTKTDAGTDFAEAWLAKNGTNVASTNTRLRLTGANDYVIFALNFVEDFAAGDTFQLRWYSLDPNIQLLAIAAPTNPARPAIPSVIVTCVPVGA